MPNDAKTFAILTTPPGRGGIAVIALAGPGAEEIVRKLFRPWKSHLEDLPGALRLGHIVDGDRILDEVVLCRVLSSGQKGDRHRPQTAAVGASLLFPPAHPRWNNPAIGREMLAALPQAQSELVVTALTQQWSAGISKLASDFLSSSRPIRASQTPQSSIVNRQFSAVLRQAAGSLPVFRKLLHPCEVVVLGPPNAGKSTLVNALVGREVSIVHAQPGTTRDWVRELALIRGVPVYLTDTAGLWEESSEIDAQAMQRAREAAAAADLVLLTGAGEEIDPASRCDACGADREIGVPRTVLRLATKCDACEPTGKFDVAVSARTEQGMEELKAAILRSLGLADIDPTAPMAFTQRQAELLHLAAEHPDQAAGLMRQLLG